MQQQSETDRLGYAQLSQHLRLAPPGYCWQAYAGNFTDAAGHLVRLTQYLEQGNLFNAWNYNLPMYCAENTTITGTRLIGLSCPSDGAILRCEFTYDNGTLQGGPLPMRYSSYTGNMGTWPTFDYVSSTTGGNNATLNAANGVLFDIGYPPGNPITIYGTPYPGRPGRSPTRFADVVDGMSSTIAYGEHAHGLFSQNADVQGVTDFYDWNWWVSGNFGDTLFTTFFPINPQRKLKTDYYEQGAFTQGDSLVLSASSFHPGGANFLFMDGSVHFLKESIDCWTIDPKTGMPPGVTYANNVYTFTPGPNARIPVYQALSTIRGGEIINTVDY